MILYRYFVLFFILLTGQISLAAGQGGLPADPEDPFAFLDAAEPLLRTPHGLENCPYGGPAVCPQCSSSLDSYAPDPAPAFDPNPDLTFDPSTDLPSTPSRAFLDSLAQGVASSLAPSLPPSGAQVHQDVPSTDSVAQVTQSPIASESKKKSSESKAKRKKRLKQNGYRVGSAQYIKEATKRYLAKRERAQCLSLQGIVTYAVRQRSAHMRPRVNGRFVKKGVAGGESDADKRKRKSSTETSVKAARVATRVTAKRADRKRLRKERKAAAAQANPPAQATAAQNKLTQQAVVTSQTQDPITGATQTHYSNGDIAIVYYTGVREIYNSEKRIRYFFNREGNLLFCHHY